MLSIRSLTLLVTVPLLYSSLNADAPVSSIPVGSPQVVANYRNDFTKPEPSNNWSYWWNELSKVDHPLAYSQLYWNGRNQYDSDGESGLPDESLLAWGGLFETGGRVGIGLNEHEEDAEMDANTLETNMDRFVVAAYTVQRSGIYAIENSFVDGQRSSGNGVEVRIYAGEELVYTGYNESMPDRWLSFDQSLGFLEAGRTIFVAIGPNGDSANDIFNLDYSITYDGVLTITPVADYMDDYRQKTPAYGWQYLWNRNGPMGDSSGYVPLHWDGYSHYDSDGIEGMPDATELFWGRISARELAPGSVAGGSVSDDRCVIAAYMVQEDGQYSISDSEIRQLESGGDGTELFVYVNDQQALKVVNAAGKTSRFDCLLGSLTKGDVIYIGVGGHRSPGVDRAYLDYTINRISR